MPTHSYELLADRYIILRAPTRQQADFQSPLIAMREAVPDVQIDIDDHVNKHTMKTLINDSTVVGFSPVIPMTD